MARLVLGKEFLEQALEQRRQSTDVRELHILQAVILPLQGYTIMQTAEIVGKSPRWVSEARRQYINNNGSVRPACKGFRNHAFQTLDAEKAFLAPFLQSAQAGRILVVGEIRRALEARLGHKVGQTTVYNLLHRHGWRKLAPDKKHVKADAETQEEWKKNCPASSPASAKNGRGKGLYA